VRTLAVVIPLVLVLLTACGGESSSASKDETSKADAPDPCELLNKAFIRAHFETGEAEISIRPSQYSSHPLCMVNWPKPNENEIQAEFQKKMQEYSMAMAKGEKPEMPKIPRPNEVSLTIMGKRFDNKAQAESALDTGMDILHNGLKSQKEGAPKMRTYEIEPVEGLGDKAAWVVGMNQISVANDRRVFHLAVNVYDDPQENRAKAMELAKLLLNKIR
jgi:hypothetical protein